VREDGGAWMKLRAYKPKKGKEVKWSKVGAI
jgi:hypothetical protein